ncbi:LysE family translocator [Gammaproteobacteria bacterium]|nr:LysE family translocator [Gammaproteobacteria bacterium]
MTLEAWLTFVVVWTLAGLPLGPNAVHTINVTVTYGYPKCLAAPLGMALACVVHACLGSLGIGALLLLFPELLLILKIAGACYLAWLGIRLWRRQAPPIDMQQSDSQSWVRLMLCACTVSLLNPKAILSYVAVFTPFIAADAALLPQLSILIPTATVLVFLNYVGYSLLAWPLRRWMSSQGKRKIFDRISGTMFFGFAGWLVYSASRSTR